MGAKLGGRGHGGEAGELAGALEELKALRAEMAAGDAGSEALLGSAHPDWRASARNLLHYLALRRHDLRPLQLRLAAAGLSSLGRAEPSVLANVDAVLAALARLTHDHWRPPEGGHPVDFAAGPRLLAEHAKTLLGPQPGGRGVRIMVTMPSEAAQEYTLVHALLQQGMDCMRINCAHDDAGAWAAMIENLRRAEKALGRRCKVAMDLGGPKLRTGPLEPGPRVVKASPERDVFGRVTAPARVWLTDEADPSAAPAEADAWLPVPGGWLKGLRVGVRVRLEDARDSRREMRVVDVSEAGCWAELSKTAYIVPGTVLRDRRSGREAPVGELPPLESSIPLAQGDLLVLTEGPTPGRPATRDGRGGVLTPASIGCTLPEVFAHIRPGEAVWFDDGKIGAVIEKVEGGRAVARITHTREGGARLLGGKGINLPESDLRLDALSPKDVEDLAFVAGHADIVELSFANTARDVEMLQQHLDKIGGRKPGMVLKIETRRGFENLPEMLLAAMRWPSCGVMIARGDLAVECGFERLAEVQEEILWICEAAHVPVIWATQVLESLAKTGMPSRAEITDAAMGHRAECVMLNKGPHIVRAVRVLDDIVRRMQAHQAKKRSMLRELRLAHSRPDGHHAAAPQAV